MNKWVKNYTKSSMNNQNRRLLMKIMFDDLTYEAQVMLLSEAAFRHQNK